MLWQRYYSYPKEKNVSIYYNKLQLNKYNNKEKIGFKGNILYFKVIKCIIITKDVSEKNLNIII